MKQKFKLISLLFLLIILTGCGQVKIKEQNIEVDDERFNSILTKLSTHVYTKSREDGYKSFSDLELALIGFSDLTNDDFTKTNERAEENNYYYTLKGNLLNENLEKYFGEKLTFDKKELIESSAVANTSFDEGSGAYIYTYDEKSDIYKVAFFGIGGFMGPQAEVEETKTVNATLKGEYIEVKQKAIYYTSEDNNNKVIYKIYSDVDKKNLIDTKTYDYDTVYNEKISVEDYLEEASIITVVFKKSLESDNYYFYKSFME